MLLQDVKKAPFEYHTNNPDKSYDHMTSTFRNLVEKHAPLKSKAKKGNSAPFMTPELNRAIYTRSRLKRSLTKSYK